MPPCTVERTPHPLCQPLSHGLQIPGVWRAVRTEHGVVVAVEHLNSEIGVTLSENLANYRYAPFHRDHPILGAEEEQRRYPQRAQSGHGIVRHLSPEAQGSAAGFIQIGRLRKRLE